MKKGKKVTSRDKMGQHRNEKSTQSYVQDTTAIKDYNKAWEDDRL